MKLKKYTVVSEDKIGTAEVFVDHVEANTVSKAIELVEQVRGGHNVAIMCVFKGFHIDQYVWEELAK